MCDPSLNYVIFDCDGGSDDAWALLLLLKAEECKHLQILAVTTTGCGNTTRECAAINMRRILRTYSRDDVPIYLGAVKPLVGNTDSDKKYFHGRDGFGDCLKPDDGLAVTQFAQIQQHAVIAIYELCQERPQQITIIAVGPLTNLALGYAMYGEQLAKNIKNLIIMGGNHQGVGNSTRAAEFNFHSDPEAAHTVLLNTSCPITILPWEPCTPESFYIPIKWRLKEFAERAAAAKHVAIDILTEVENAQYESDNWNPCDALVVAAWLFDKQFVKKDSHWHATVDLTGTHTRGQMVLDHLKDIESYPENIRIIERVDAEFFKHIVEWVAGLRDITFL